MWSYAPRVGLAWDVFGDGKTAIRASTGIFYNFVNRSTVWVQRRWARSAAPGPIRARRSTTSRRWWPPATSSRARRTRASRSVSALPSTATPSPEGELEPERNYHVNLAFQRDIGFNTVAEVAYVSNIGRKYWRNKTVNNIPVNAYADPNNLFNGEAINANFLRRDFSGVGSISYLTTNDDILNYNAMQLSVQRRLTKGLQMGMAYTLSKSEGMQGWDFMTEELYGKQGLRDRYYGPPAGNPTGVQDGRQDRRHVVVVNYSYMIPNPTPNVTILKHVLRDWEASGVSTFMSGSNVNPTCNTNLSRASTMPTRRSRASPFAASSCRARTSQLPAWTGDPNAHDAFRPHFNLNAFRRPAAGQRRRATSATRSQGVLRHPGWQNWDFTLARRIPVNIGRGGSLRVQAQFYNVFNLVQFQRLAASYTFSATGNTNTTTGPVRRGDQPVQLRYYGPHGLLDVTRHRRSGFVRAPVNPENTAHLAGQSRWRTPGYRRGKANAT